MTDFEKLTLDISKAWAACRYDHMPHLPESAWPKWRTKECRQNYATFKCAVAEVLKPESIVEIGVGFAVAARAFLEAVPHANYTGFDNGSMDARSTPAAHECLRGRDATITQTDSILLTRLPQCDLAHVDGCHAYGHAFHDTLLALRAAEWVLVDDAKDSQVAAAALQALFCFRPGSVEWAYFGDTWTGDLLLRGRMPDAHE